MKQFNSFYKLLLMIVVCFVTSTYGYADDEARYALKVVSKPEMAGSFNTSSASLSIGEVIHLYAYANSNFSFKEWVAEDGTVISKAQDFEYTMPAGDVRLTAVYEYNPANPANPAPNEWNPNVGNVIIDDFTAGSLSKAVSNAIGNSKGSEVLMITVAGVMNNNDFGVINSYSNCTLLDISRVTGVVEVPSYAFDYTNLESVCLPASVERIGYMAFGGCANLQAMTVYAMTPPVLQSNVFQGVQDGLVVYVPAAAIAQYQDADGWKDFTILPIQEDIRSLSISLPDGASANDYSQMWLELTNTKSGQKMHYVMTDRTTYTFSNIIRNTSWNVVLRNQRGDVFGKIDNIEVKDEDVSVVFSSLAKPQNVSLTVKTPNGDNVTSNTQITWLDADGNYIAQSTGLSGLLSGYAVNYKVVLSQDLAMQYVAPEQKAYIVNDANNNLTLTLEPIKQVTISGCVKDLASRTALNGATVTASQTFGGKYSKTVSTKTDAKGNYVLTVSNVPTSLAVSASDYISQTIVCDSLMNGEDVVTITDVSLKGISGAVVTLGLTYTKCPSEDGSEETFQEWYADYNNVAYSIYNKSKQKSINQFNVQYPQIVLLEEVDEGDVLEMTATSKVNAFMPVKTTATVDAEQRANAAFNIVELGKIKSAFAKNSNAAVVGSLYNANGKLVKSYDYSNASLTINDLTDGSYTLVTMGASKLFNSIYDLSQLPQTGLVLGSDYTQATVDVKSGKVCAIDIEEVPTLDESKLYYTGENTSFTVNKSSIVAGNYLTLTGHLDFKSAYAGNVSNVNLIVDLPESCEFVENSVMVGNNTSSYTVQNHRITIPMARYTDRVRFCIIPTRGGDYAPSALAQFDIDGETVTQPIGSANYTAKDLSINVPKTAAKTTIPVSGTAIGMSTVEIYDGDVLIGQTTSLANGTWSAACELIDAYNLSSHRIYAKVLTKTGVELKSENASCLYDKNAIEVRTVTMINTAHTAANLELHDYVTVIDFQNPQADIPPYWYWPSYPEFTFLIDFTNNDTTVISHVKLDVLTSDNKIRTLFPQYNSKKHKYVVSDKFDASSLPVNVSVDFSTHTTKEIDYDKLITKIDELFEDTDILPDSLLQATVDSVFYYDHYDSVIESTISNLQKQLDKKSYPIPDLEIEELMNAKSEEEEKETIVRIVTNYIESIGIPNVPISTKDNVACWNDIPVSECVRTVLTGKPWESDVVKKITKDLNLENTKFEVSNIDQERLVGDKTYRDGIIRSFDKIELVTDNMNLDDLILNYESNCPKFNLGSGDGNNSNNNEQPEILIYPPTPSCPVPYPTGSPDYKYKEWAGRHDEMNSKWTSLSSQAASFFGIASDVVKYLNIKKAWSVIDAIEKQHGLMTFSQYLKLNKNIDTAVKCGSWSKNLGIGSAVLSGISIGIDQWNKWDECKKWDYIIEHIEQGCLNGDTKDYLLEMAINSKKYNEEECNKKSWIDAGLTGWGSLSFVFPPFSFAFAGSALAGTFINNRNGEVIEETNKNNMLYIMSAVNSSKLCRPFPEDFLSDLLFSNTNLKYVLDPSGFVYEGVTSNRIEGVTVTAYYKEMVEDMYGDLHENVVKWDAEEYAQKNPLFTDEKGMYAWDVPQGLWQVKFEKEGYETTYSEWLPVPPPQLDVNIAMTQNVQPNVKNARAYEDAVEVEFDKYMMPEMLNTDNIIVMAGDKQVEGSIELLNEEVKYEGESETFASKLRFNATEPFEGTEVTLMVNNRVKSYAGIRMQDNYSQSFTIEQEIRKIVCDSATVVRYGDNGIISVSVLPASASAGKTINVRSSSQMILGTDVTSVVLDANGKADIPVSGELPGTAALTFTIDSYDLSATTIVNVQQIDYTEIAAPTANIASGTTVEKGTKITLTCATKGATIYYTLDGSCPCDEATRLAYTEPIVINETVTIKAMAVAPDMTESDIVEFTYVVHTNVETPTASLPSGSSMYNGTSVKLSADSKDMKIWYTKDGTDPRDENGSRKQYAEPIIINSDMTLKAMAENADGDVSDVATFVYDILQSKAGVSLSEGWNWVSFNMKNDALSSVNTALASGTWSSDDVVKDNKYVDMYSANQKQWIGTLSKHGALNNMQMYKVHSSKAQTLGLTGEAVHPLETTITVGAGWNYISYVPLVNMNVNDALKGYRAENGDVIKSQDAFATYTTANGWEGDLTTLTVGRGYMLKRGTNASQATFTYPVESSGASTKAAAPVKSYHYADNMNIIGEVEGISVVDGDSLVAYVNGEVRGASRLERSKKVFLTVQGDEEAKMAIVLVRGGEIVATASNLIGYQSNNVLGTSDAPTAITFVTDDSCLDGNIGNVKAIYSINGIKMNTRRLNSIPSGTYIIYSEKNGNTCVTKFIK